MNENIEQIKKLKFEKNILEDRLITAYLINDMSMCELFKDLIYNIDKEIEELTNEEK